MLDTPALNNLAIVLFRPKFSENVGSCARAMANMGCPTLILVAPQQWDEGRARALATTKGHDILARMEVHDTLAQALAPFRSVYGTTARTGGWRTDLLTPESAAAQAVPAMLAGARTAIVFGPEDKGLTNDETQICGRLLTIPTAAPEASSLNLSQAVLIALYEFFQATARTPALAPDQPGDRLFAATSPDQTFQLPAAAPDLSGDRPATHQERETLFANLRTALLSIDFLKPDNPDYWMLPIRRFAERVSLKRSEFNLLMGVCRQIKWAVGRRDAGDGSK